MSSNSGCWMARRTTDLAILFAAATVAAAAIAPAVAEPYMALRTGNSCASCHTNTTGGGKRTLFGATYGLQDLPAWQFPLPEGRAPVDGTIASWLSLGADFRAGNYSRTAKSGDTNSFETDEANLYTDLSLLPDRLKLYADVRLAPGGAQTREIFALVDHLPGKLYVKAGRFFAPYGWRIQDDTSYIRARTGFNFQSPDDGLEIGWRPSNLSASIAATNGAGGGSDDNTNKRVSLISVWTWPAVSAGFSAASNRQGDISSKLAGIQLGAKMGERLVALAEVDAGRDEMTTTGETTHRVLGYAEAYLLAMKGWFFKSAFDYLDPDTSESGDEENRLTLGTEWFATNHVQLRFLWRRTDRPPEVHGATFEDDREVILELHVFL